MTTKMALAVMTKMMAQTVMTVCVLKPLLCPWPNHIYLVDHFPMHLKFFTWHIVRLETTTSLLACSFQSRGSFFLRKATQFLRCDSPFVFLTTSLCLSVCSLPSSVYRKIRFHSVFLFFFLFLILFGEFVFLFLFLILFLYS